MNDMRLICFTAGMTQEFEVIRTDATDEIIEKQLKLNCYQEESGKVIDNPYGMLEENGYIVELIGCQDDMDKPEDATFFDWYDYYSD